MKKLAATIGLGLLLTVGIAAANEVANPVVKERKDVMQAIRINTATLGDMASGKTTFDAPAATAAKTALAAAAADIVVKFEANEDDPKSEATPAIWLNYADYTAKAEVLVSAAEAIDTTTLEGIKAGMGPVGATCRDCHQLYRAKR